MLGLTLGFCIALVFAYVDIDCALGAEKDSFFFLGSGAFLADRPVSLEHVGNLAEIAFMWLLQRLVLVVKDAPLDLVQAALAQVVERRLEDLGGLFALGIVLEGVRVGVGLRPGLLDVSSLR